MHPKAAAILAAFQSSGDYISGESICRALGISRTAVWKHISMLRGSGFEIAAVPSRGYRLVSCPDLLDSITITPHLKTGRIGRVLHCLATTASTNSDAFRLAEGGAAEGTVVVADCQTEGKGRRGRVWSSPAGVNLYCSLILRPDVMPQEAPRLTFLSAVAVVRAIGESTGLSARIKWPNDVLLDGRKVAGLLNEMSAETDAVNFIVLGIGVNLNMTADQFPGDLRYPATSLMLSGGTQVDRARFAARLLNHFELLYDEYLHKGFAPIRKAWQELSNAAGCRIEVTEGETQIACGMFAGIDDDGALLISGAGGRVERILSGDVRVLDAAGH